jgi:hypothetical protein
MIKLDTAFITNVQHTLGANVVSTTVTDTLLVFSATLNLTTSVISAVVKRGTLVAGVFTENMDALTIAVNPDGSFMSTDGTWSGSMPAASVASLFTSMKTTFDQFILGSGAVTGTQI